MGKEYLPMGLIWSGMGSTFSKLQEDSGDNTLISSSRKMNAINHLKHRPKRMHIVDDLECAKVTCEMNTFEQHGLS